MELMTAAGQPSYEAWLAGCTCSRLRGYGVAEPLEEWREVVLSPDPECVRCTKSESESESESETGG